MNERDEVRLRAMLDTAQHGIQFIQGKSRQDLDTNVLLAFALTHAVEMVSRTVSQVTTALGSYPELESRQIFGLHESLIHKYAEVDLNVVWDAAERELPILIEQIKQILEDNGLPPNP